MARDVRVKICGLSRPQDVAAVVAAGAAYGGLVFFARSPRAVSIPQARALALEFPVGLARVGLLVDPTDAYLDAVLAEVPLDILQLHGRESPERVTEIRARYGLPVMKAVGVASTEDLAGAGGLRAGVRHAAGRCQATQGRGAAGRQRAGL